MPKRVFRYLGVRVAPLNASFMAASIIGFVISAIYLSQYSRNWAFAFGVLFALMFVASLISMQYGPVRAQMGPRTKQFLKGE